MISLFFIILGFTIVGYSNSDPISTFTGCEGEANEYDIYSEEPTLVKTVKNGKLLQIGDPSLNSSWYIASLHGTHYEMGEALGELLQDELYYFFTDFWEDFIKWFFDTYAKFLPTKIREFVETKGIELALDLIYELTKSYTPTFFFEYMKGIAAGSGSEYKNVRRFNYIPSLMNAACTIVGATDSATPSGKLLQIRTLDQAIPGSSIIVPLMQNPTFQVLHFNDSTTVVNINTAGFVGMLSGFSNQYLSISQKWWPTFDTFDPFERGMPWHFMLFEGLRVSKTVEEYMQFIDDTKRTTSSFLGVGDGRQNEFYGAKFAFNNMFEVFTWENSSVYDCHPRIQDILYIDKEIPPSKNPCLPELLEYYRGEEDLTAENFVRQILPLSETGDSMSVLYDYFDHSVYASWGVDHPAYNKQYVKMKMEDLFQY